MENYCELYSYKFLINGSAPADISFSHKYGQKITLYLLYYLKKEEKK